jgi:hypothetical protein
MEPQDFYDFTRCVRPNGTAYGTGGQCRKGHEEALSQRVGKGFLAKASTEKLKEYANRAPYKYQRDAIKAELARRGAGEAKSQKKAPSVPADLKKQLAALNGPTNRGLQREKNKLDKEQRELEKQIAALKAQLDGKPAPKEGKPSQKIDAKFLKEATKEKLEEYLRRAPYQYQRDKIQKALDERAKLDATKKPSVKQDDGRGTGYTLPAKLNLEGRGEKVTPSAVRREGQKLADEKADAKKEQDERNAKMKAEADENLKKALGDAKSPSFDPKVLRLLGSKDLDELERNYIKADNTRADRRIEAIRDERARRKGQGDQVQAKEKSKLAKFGDDQLRNQLVAAEQLGREDKARLIREELGRRAKVAPQNGEKFKNWGDKELQDQLSWANKQARVGEADAIEKELARRGVAPRARGADGGRPAKMERWDHENMVKLDERVEKDTTSRVGKEDFVWGNSLKSDAKVLGQGAYGTAIKDRDGTVVKRGVIGDNEAKIIDRVGKAGLGPKLIAAELDGAGFAPGTHNGRVAMTLVPGSPIGKKKGDEPIGKTGKVVSDAYWEARAKLHRMGIAHNDMHIENVFIDRKGTGRFVDMGLAQDNPKAALAEAMGAFTSPPSGSVRKGGTDSGDWQMRRWNGSGGKDFENAERSTSPAVKREFAQRFPVAAKVLENKEKAISKMKSFGLSDQDVADVIGHGIRSKDSSFEKGAMGKLTNAQAQSIIDTLYDGI